MTKKIRHWMMVAVIAGIGLIPQTIKADDSFYNVQVGDLFGMEWPSFPTTILSGSGPLDPLLFGRDFFIVCMQEDHLPWTDFAPVDMYVGNTTLTLTNGMWASISETQGGVIANATRNMYYNNINAVLSSPDSYGDGYLFQLATWYITTAYQDEIWSGSLDLIKINEIFAYGQTLFEGSPRTPEQEARVYEFLLTSLSEAAGDIFFLQIPDAPEYQPFAIVVIPEPSSILLTSSVLGAMALVAHRRRKGIHS